MGGTQRVLAGRFGKGHCVAVGAWPPYVMAVTMPLSVARPVDSYFVCGTPRSGSSLLLGLLESTGVAGRPQAYFREPDEPLWADRWQVPHSADGGFDYADYLRAALAAGRTENGVFGAKLMWGTLDELVVKLGRVFPDLSGDDAGLLTSSAPSGSSAIGLSRPGTDLAFDRSLEWLKRRMLRPQCRYRAVVDTADESAKLAGECAIIRRAVALARWVRPEGKALTRVGVLRKPAVPGACAAIGIPVPERFRSAADIPGLHRPWTAALAFGVLEIVGDRAAASPELDGWPAEGDRAGRWLEALRAVCAEITGGAADDTLGLLVLALAELRSLSAGIRLSSREVIDAAHAIADERGLGLMQVNVLGGMSAVSRGFLADGVESLLGLLAEFGAVTAGKEPAVTPLGEWAIEHLEADLPCGVSPDATAGEAITAVAVARASDRWQMAQGWLCVRKPADAVRELLAAADPLPAWLRDAAAAMAAMTGEDGLPGWHAIARNATGWPSSARLARAELHDWGRAPEPSPADRRWLGVEGAAAALLARGEAWPEGQGADEALCRLWAAAGGGPWT